MDEAQELLERITATYSIEDLKETLSSPPDEILAVPDWEEQIQEAIEDLEIHERDQASLNRFYNSFR